MLFRFEIHYSALDLQWDWEILWIQGLSGRGIIGRRITCKQVLFEQDLLCTAPVLPLLPGALPAPQELKDEPTSGR